jgi:hypothetical protein
MHTADRSSRSICADTKRAASMAWALLSIRFDARWARISVAAAMAITIDMIATVIASSARVVPTSRSRALLMTPR